MVEVASSRLTSPISLAFSSFSSKCILLCASSQNGTQYWFINITRIQVFLVRPDNMPRSTHKYLNIYYPSLLLVGVAPQLRWRWRASGASETHSISAYRKKFGLKNVKTTMRMLTILCEAEEWTRVHLLEACLLFASTITKSSLYVSQNDKMHAHQITLLSLAP